jgi:glycosyltransferase involved in cell wall biosynthesis
MAGPAIRAWEIARALSTAHDVRLASTVGASVTQDAFDVVFAAGAALRPHAEWAEVVLVQGHILRSHPWLKDLDVIIVADIYDPLHLEQLEQGKDLPDADRLAVAIDAVEVMNDQMERADYMVCASEKQRDFWLGQLAGLARINPVTYDHDQTLRSLIDVAPFGVSDDPPRRSGPGIRGVVDGIGDDDRIILWGGGIYNWFDPITLIRAVGEIASRHEDVRLFFLGVKHPNPDVPQMQMEVRARELAAELGLLDSVVFFNETWVPYEHRANFLLDADIGVSTHFEHIETAFSFRTRILDYFWAGLPVVCTEGDNMAELVGSHDLGRVVPEQDVAALTAALEHFLYDEVSRRTTAARVAEFARTITWSASLGPLLQFFDEPRVAPDRAAGVRSERTRIMDDLEKRVSGMEGSTSWRLTAPLRALGDRRASHRRPE